MGIDLKVAGQKRLAYKAGMEDLMIWRYCHDFVYNILIRMPGAGPNMLL